MAKTQKNTRQKRNHICPKQKLHFHPILSHFTNNLHFYPLNIWNQKDYMLHPFYFIDMLTSLITSSFPLSQNSHNYMLYYLSTCPINSKEAKFKSITARHNGRLDEIKRERVGERERVESREYSKWPLIVKCP